jgi:hypothetical protein
LGFGVLHKADRKAPLVANVECVCVCVCACMCHCACNCIASLTLLPMHARDPLFCLDLGIFVFCLFWTGGHFLFPRTKLAVYYRKSRHKKVRPLPELFPSSHALCKLENACFSAAGCLRLPGVCDTVRRCGSIIIIFVIMLQIRSFASSGLGVTVTTVRPVWRLCHTVLYDAFACIVCPCLSIFLTLSLSLSVSSPMVEACRETLRNRKSAVLADLVGDADGARRVSVSRSQS